MESLFILVCILSNMQASSLHVLPTLLPIASCLLPLLKIELYHHLKCPLANLAERICLVALHATVE